MRNFVVTILTFYILACILGNVNEAHQNLAKFNESPQMQLMFQILINLTTSLIEVVIIAVVWLANISITLTRSGGLIEKQTNLLGRSTEGTSS